MNLRAIIIGVGLAVTVGALGFVLATHKPLDHGIIFLGLIAGFIICDRSIWSDRSR